MRNVGLKYVCKPVQVRRECRDALLNACANKVLTIPIGHMEGNYFCDPTTLEVAPGQPGCVPLFLSRGEITTAANPNGSWGITSQASAAPGEMSLA